MSRLRALFGEESGVLGDRNFQVLLLASVCSPLGESAISPILDSLSGPFGVSTARIGLLMAAYTAPAIVGIPLVGVVSDRYGRRPVLAAGLVLLGVAGLAIPFTTDFRVALALRAVQGLGYCGIGPVLVTSLGDLYGGDAEATAQGLRFTTVSVALAAIPVAAGLLFVLSWRAPLVLFGLALPVAAAVLLFMDEPTQVGRVDAPAVGTDGGHPGGGLDDLLAALRRPGLAALLVGRTTPSFLWFAFLTYASVLVVRVLGGTPGQAGGLVAVASVASAIGATQLGRLTAVADSRVGPLALAAVAACLGLAGVALAPTLLVAAGGAAVFGGGFSVLVSLYRSTLSTRAPPAVRGGVVSAGESLGRLGTTAAPVAGGVFIAWATTSLGFEAAVRWALLGSTGVALVVATGSIAVAARSGVLEKRAGAA